MMCSASLIHYAVTTNYFLIPILGNYTLKIQVTNTTGDPIFQANVTIWNSTEQITSELTNMDGKISDQLIFTNGNPHKIYAAKTPYLTQNFNNTILADSNWVIVLYKEEEMIVMYDVAIVIGSAILSAVIIWLGTSIKLDPKLDVLKPFFLFLGFGLIIITFTLMRTVSVTAGASSGTLQLLDAFVSVSTWLWLVSLFLYFIVFLWNLLKDFMERRRIQKWGPSKTV